MKAIFALAMILMPVAAQSMCYTVYDASDKLVYRSTNSPVSLKGSLGEAVQQRFPGGAMLITNGNCPPYDRATAEAQERAKSAEAKLRKVQKDEAARAAAEQTERVREAQEASRLAVAARRAAEAARAADIQAARYAERSAIRSSAATTTGDELSAGFSKYRAEKRAAEEDATKPKSSANTGSVEDQLRKTADETRKNLPMLIGEGIQATNIAAVGKTLLLRHNFTTKSASSPNLTRLKAELYSSAVKFACTTPDTINALKQGVTFSYQYYDSDNNFVMQYDVSRRSCGK